MVKITKIETKDITNGSGNWVAEVRKYEFFSDGHFFLVLFLPE